MHRGRYITYLITIIILFLLFPTFLLTVEASAVIKGRIVNKTITDKGVNNIVVKLLRSSNDVFSEVTNTKTDKTGNFIFNNISFSKDDSYFIFTKYKGVDYLSPPIKSNQSNVVVSDLSIYETTASDQNIHVKMHHIFLEAKDDSLGVRELVIIENRGNKTYIGYREVRPGKRETLRISLPKGATNIQSVGPILAFKSNDDFIDTTAIKPGIKRVLFAYTINSPVKNYQFSKRINLRTDNLDFIFPDSGITVKSNDLDFAEPIINAGKRFLILKGNNFLAGTNIVIDIMGRNFAGNQLKWVIVILVSVLIGIGLTLSVFKRNENSANYKKGGYHHSPLLSNKLNQPNQRLVVLQSIAELDNLFESGLIVQDEYKLKRKHLLNIAKKLTMNK